MRFCCNCKNILHFWWSPPTCGILIDHCDGLPLVELHNIQHSPANGGIFWVQVNVEAVLVVHRRVFPPGLYMRNLQGVTDGLHSADRGAVGGAKDCSHAQPQLITCWGQTETCEHMQKQLQHWEIWGWSYSHERYEGGVTALALAPCTGWLYWSYFCK